MGLPLKSDLATLDWSKDGLPWCKATARSDIDCNTLDWSKDGLPWVVNPGYGPAQFLYPGDIASAEALGALNLVQESPRVLPERLFLDLSIRRLWANPANRQLIAVPQIPRLQVIPDA